MKKEILVAAIAWMISTSCFSQTNVFPPDGNVGVGTTTTSAKLHIQAATEQLRLGYDASNFAAFTVDNGANLSIGNAYPNHIKQLTLNYYTTGGYGGRGLKLSDVGNGYSVVLQAMVGNKLYLTDASGNATALTLGIHENPTDGSQFVAAYNKWYLTAGNFAVGTANPISKAAISGNMSIGSAYADVFAAPTDGLLVQGKVGIGTSFANSYFTVKSPDLYPAEFCGVSTNTVGPYGVTLRVRNSNATNGNYAGIGFEDASFLVASIQAKITDHTNHYGDIVFATKGSGDGDVLERIRVTSSGNVGIGTTEPGLFKLAVEGNIGARKLVIKQTTWADYVFDNSYNLPTLEEIEAFIKTHKHLPGIVSAKEVEKDGLDVGENQVALLKKIEELTLYMIELKKKVDQQDVTIVNLQQQLKTK